MDMLTYCRALISLHSYFTTRFGIGNRLLFYLALPRQDVPSFDQRVMIDNMTRRVLPEDSLKAGLVPQDTGIFKHRLMLLANNNEAYRIAMMEDPTVEVLEQASYLDATWSWLFAIKHYLMHHLDLAVKYRGLVPFGSEVVKFCNTLDEKPRVIPASLPSYADHMWLRDITVRESILQGIPTVEVNNIFYAQGKLMP